MHVHWPLGGKPLAGNSLERRAMLAANGISTVVPDAGRSATHGSVERMLTNAADGSTRAWLAAALRDGHLPAHVNGEAPDDIVAVAAVEGVVALLEMRLRAGGGWEALPAHLREAIADESRAMAAQWLMREHELRRISRVLEQAGLRILLLKGCALALWLYPRPYLRMGGDIDVLLESRDEAERAVGVLSDLGYALAFAPGSTHYEMTCRLVVDGVMRSELDLHFRLLNSVAYAEIFGFEELWDHSIALPGMGEHLRGLSPSHALAHAGLNRMLDMQNSIPDRLKLLYDIRLLADRNGPAEWDALCALAVEKSIAGACLLTLEDAERWLGALVPAGLQARLRALAQSEPLDYRRSGDWRYMQWQNLKTLPTLRERANWLRERLLPNASQLRELHGEGTWWRLMLRRLHRGLTRLR